MKFIARNLIKVINTNVVSLSVVDDIASQKTVRILFCLLLFSICMRGIRFIAYYMRAALQMKRK